MSQRNISTIARAEAVAQLSSTEQLDRRLVVVRGESWIVLVVSLLLMSLAIAWGVLGRLPDVVEGQGVIAPAGTQPVEINSPSAVGGVVDLIAPEYRTVAKGDPLVRLHNRDLEVAVENATARVEMLQSQDGRMTEAESGILAKRKASLDAQLAAADQTSTQMRNLAGMLETELKELKELVDQQLVPRAQLVSTQQNYFSVRQEIARQDTVVTQAKADYDALVTRTEQDRLARESTLAAARNDLDAARTRLEVSTLVRSPIGGTVLDHRVDLGSTVSVGTTVTSIRPDAADDAELQATVYVPYGTGRRIRTGMPVQISLPFARPSRYGYILGEVTGVSTYVAGNAAAVHLGSEELARDMAAELGPMLEVTVRLDRDDATPSGLRWTSRGGYEGPMDYPVLCGVRVVVRENRPIDLVLPWIKDVLGLDPPATVVGNPAE